MGHVGGEIGNVPNKKIGQIALYDDEREGDTPLTLEDPLRLHDLEEHIKHRDG